MAITKTIYWDSCIFIAWMKDEKRSPGEMDGVYECVEYVQNGKNRIVTSVMTRTEVFETDLPPGVREKYTNLLNRRNVQVLDQDLRVSNLAREIREFFEKQRQIDQFPGIPSPDAVHLATAIHYRVDEFWTFDNGGYKSRSLLSLNGNVAGYPLVITKPVASQLRLQFSS